MTLTDLAPETNQTLLQRVFEDQIAQQPEVAITPEKLSEIYEFVFACRPGAALKDEDIKLFSLSDYSIPTIVAYGTRG